MRRAIVAVVAVAVTASVAFAMGAGNLFDREPAPAPEAEAVPEALPVRTIEATPVSLDDATIVAIFDAANTADIETGRLAAEQGASKEVREFGAMLARDHAQVRQQGRDLAARLGVTPTPPKDGRAAADHAAAMQRLRALKGAAFDRAFLQHEDAFHAAVIEAVTTTLLPAIRNAELKALVVKVAPAFEAHMLAARHMEQELAAAQR